MRSLTLWRTLILPLTKIWWIVSWLVPTMVNAGRDIGWMLCVMPIPMVIALITTVRTHGDIVTTSFVR